MILVLEHFIIGLLFYFVSLNAALDTIGYYITASESSSWGELFSLGTGFIRFLIYPFIKIGTSYFNLFFIFTTIGLIGFCKIYELLLSELSEAITSKKRYLILLLLPTFHFFTSGIGKDNLMLYFMISIFIGLKNNKLISFNFLFNCLMVFLIRPHIFIFLLTSYGVVLFFSKEFKLIFKITIPVLAVGLVVFLSPVINEKFGVNIFSIESIQEAFFRTASRSARENAKGSVVNFLDANFLEKMLAYSYLPIFWKADNIFKYLVSIENLYLVILLLSFLIKKGTYRFIKRLQFYQNVMLVFVLITWSLLSQTIYNLGLASRQKYMYIPFLYIIIIIYLANSSVKKVADV